MKNFLTKSERDNLRVQHRQEKKRRVADHIKEVLLSVQGWSYRQIAQALLLNKQTVGRHVEECLRKKKLTLSSGGSESKLNAVQTTLLVAHLERITYLKIEGIYTYVRTAYGVSHTIKGMISWMHNHGFSYKKPKGTPSKTDPIKQEDFIKQYEELLNTTPANEAIVSVDGVLPTMATKITYGWIKTGTSKPIATAASRTRVNLIGALNLEIMEVTIGEYKTIDSLAMIEYLDQVKAAYSNAQKSILF